MAEPMNWGSIDHSPLWNLSVEERALLHRSNDPAFRALWADCFSLCLHTWSNDLDGEAFCTAFLRCFDRYDPKENGRFSNYLLTSVKHEVHHVMAEESIHDSGQLFGRETARKIKKALAYMAQNGYTAGAVSATPALEQTIADIAGVGARTLHHALVEQLELIRLDEPLGEDGATHSEQIADPDENFADSFGDTKEAFPRLHRCVNLMSLEQKEKYGKRAGLLWSSVLMGYLRCNEKDPVETKPERLARCDDLRPLEADNCLWGCLLLPEYIAYTVMPPLQPQMLTRAALNSLVDNSRPPHQDQTIAAYLGVSKAAVSQRRKLWVKNVIELFQPDTE